MKVPNERLLHHVKQWLSIADEDLRLAEHAMTLPYKEEPPYRLIAYHAQQCAEKCLKAYLVYCGVDFPYTHNISILLELCSERATWTAELRDAEQLTLYSITTRYPGEDQEVTETEAKRAIELARQVRTQVRTDLKQLGVDLPE
jgi:HEPN domain-containing protein